MTLFAHQYIADWWSNPVAPTADHDFGWDDACHEVMSGLMDEAGRQLTDREFEDALDYFSQFPWSERDRQAPLGMVDYNPEWHRCNPGDVNIFLPVLVVDLRLKRLAVKVESLRIRVERDPLVGPTPSVKRIIYSVEPGICVHVFAGRSGACHQSSDRQGSDDWDQVARRLNGLKLGGKLAAWIRPPDAIGLSQLLDELATVLDRADDLKGVAGARRSLKRLLALLRVFEEPISVTGWVTSPPVGPRVEAAGGKTGRYAPLD